MKTWNEFIDEICASEPTVFQILDNYDELCKNGMIGDCLLRRVSQAWAANLDQPFSTSYMVNIANECAHRLARKYIYSVDKWMVSDQ